MVTHSTRPEPEASSGVSATWPSSVTSRTIPPGAPDTVTTALTALRSDTGNRSPMPAERLPAVQSKVSCTAADSAIQARPARTPSRMDRVSSPRASTAVCGRPITWPGRCASEVPTAGSQRPDRPSSTSRPSHVDTDTSSSAVHGPFQTSTASSRP